MISNGVIETHMSRQFRDDMQTEKNHLFKIITWLVLLLATFLVFLIALSVCSHYFYLCALGHRHLMRPFFAQTFSHAVMRVFFLITRYWRFLIQGHVFIILAALIAFPFVRSTVRRCLAEKISYHKILKVLYDLVPWLRGLCLAVAFAYFILYGWSQYIGINEAKRDMNRWRGYINRCLKGEISDVQTLALEKIHRSCVYVVGVHQNNILFFDGRMMHLFNLTLEKETIAWVINISGKSSDQSRLS
jgi:hypothetical protein